MTQQAGARRRPTKAAPGGQGLRIPWARLAADGIGFVLLAISLISLLSALHAEGAIAEPLGRFLALTFGWLGPIAALWPAVLALVVLSHRVAPGPWPWTRLTAAAFATLALLG